MKRNLRTLVCLVCASSTLVMVGCGSEQYCNDHAECLETEVCSADNRCVDNPCFNRDEGDFVECSGGDAVTCDASGMPALEACGQYGCGETAAGCLECVPGSGRSCDGDDVIDCNSVGLIESREFCVTGCLDQPGGEAVCAPCEPDTVACYGEYLVTCDADREASSERCAHGCHGGRAECNDCTPDATECDADELVTCDGEGLVEARDPCPYGCAASRGVCSECLADAVACQGDDLVTCGPLGVPLETETCAYGCNVANGACQACVPEAIGCQGDELVECSAAGEITSQQTCENGCNTTRSECNACEPSTTYCAGDALVTCGTDGLVASAASCALGCDATEIRCSYFQPTGLDWTDVTAGSVSLVVPHFQIATIDTTAEVIMINGQYFTGYASRNATLGGFDTVWVVSFDQVDIQGELRVTGDQSIAIVARSSITVGGWLDVSAHLNVPGAGGVAPGESHPGNGSGPSCSGVASAGGGGGGHAGLGGEGGTITGYASGGSGLLVDDWQLNPLWGGGAGGSCPSFGIGGAAGGNVLLVAGELIDVQLGGIVDASGGGGVSTTAGGGAGGTVSLEAPVVTIAGTINNRGGGGGCWQDNGADGRIGGTGCTSVVAGGDGGGPNAVGLNGEQGENGTGSYGGAGGGAAGVIVINVGPSQGAPEVTGALIPDATTSAVHLGNLTPQ